MKQIPASRKIILQWHITDRCNYRCSHCYQDRYTGNELDLPGLLGVLEQYMLLLDRQQARGHITVTGGEPYLRSDFPDLLRAISENRSRASFGILTNGSFIDVSEARRLKQLNTNFVQVSIEGSRSTHDAIRGRGSFDRAVKALDCLARQGVGTLISFTAHQANFREFPEVARLGRSHKVRRVWADRIIARPGSSPCAVLSPEETREFIELMAGARQRTARNWFSRTEISMGRALQFLAGGGKPYFCQAGSGLVTIMPDGALYPCRRLPMPAGNILETPLSTLYTESMILRELREQRGATGCEKCFYRDLCRGGLRCLAYATTGNPFTADPGCWRASSSISHHSASSRSLNPGDSVPCEVLP